MTEEITPLSEKERMGQNALPLNGVFFLTEDVREFIKRLQIKIGDYCNYKDNEVNPQTLIHIQEYIQQLAGDKLI